MRSPVAALFSFVVLAVSVGGAGFGAAQQATVPALVGTWDGTYEPPAIVGGDPCSLLLEADGAQGFRAQLVLPDARELLKGRFDAAEQVLHLTREDDAGTLDLRFADDTLVGLAHDGAWVSGFRLRRASEKVLERRHDKRVVELASKERPEDFATVGLEPELGFRLDDLVRAVAERAGVVGLSIACVVDGVVVDVRSLGWEDFFGDVPAGVETRYRWASISKPLTATTALRLAAAGHFDLDADLRSWVPEFPDKGARITPRRILCHQSGIVHYEGAVRTWREYDEPFPFERLANGLDLFREAPLLAEPGTRFSYSTHAWTLLGLALERASKEPYAELVRQSVLEPAHMAHTEPDFRSRSIPHRSKGYEHSEGRLLETLNDDVSWKLPGGGWTSTVEDLARFGAALLGSSLLDEEQKAQAWTTQQLADGSDTEVGLGFFLGTLGGRRLVSHSGGQRKASTFLALLPEQGLAVAVMSNTEGAPMGELAQGALRLLLERD